MSEKKYNYRFSMRRSSDDDNRETQSAIKDEVDESMARGKKKTDPSLISVINYEDLNEANKTL